MPTNKFYMMKVGMISGLISWISVFLPLKGMMWMPGIVFGLAVSIPLTQRTNYRIVRILLSSTFSVLSYFIAFSIQLVGSRGNYYTLYTAIAGFVGSLLFSIGINFTIKNICFKSFFYTVLNGTLFGLVFGLLMTKFGDDDESYILKLALAFIVWQGGTAIPLGTIIHRTEQPPHAGGEGRGREESVEN